MCSLAKLMGAQPVLQKAAVRTALRWSFAFFWKVS
jgi:hypothetical protein